MTIESIGSQEALRVAELAGVTINPEPSERSELERKLVETYHPTAQGWTQGQCKVCACTFVDEPRVLPIGVILQATVCESCGPMVTRHYTPNTEEKIVTATPWWNEHCPLVYREMIEADKLPATVDSTAMAKVKQWGASRQRGLILLGASGAGKTLSLWSKARELERTGTKPVFLSAVEFARKLALAARDLEKAEWLMKCRVLIVDDLGKEKLSTAVASLVWEVIDARNNARLPTLISTRFRGDNFVARFGEQILGEDVRGRIADCSDIVEFRSAR